MKSIKIEDELHKKIKILSAHNGVTLAKWISDACQDKLKQKTTFAPVPQFPEAKND